MKHTVHTIQTLALAFLVGFALVGCDSATDDESLDMETATDVATTVALTVSEDDGGVADQIEDVVALTNELSLNKQGGASTLGSPPEYDEETGTWTVDIDRSRTSPNSSYSASFARTYEYQFLDADGQPQQFFVTDSTRAKTVIFRIVDGSGEYSSPRVLNTLNTLSADWTVNNADEDVFSVTGNYRRVASSIIERALISRTLAYDFNISEFNITVPRNGQMGDITGTMSGAYEAQRTADVENGERTVDVSVTVDITIADNSVTIDVDRERFISQLDTGELID